MHEEILTAAHADHDHDFDVALYVTGWTDIVRLIENDPNAVLTTAKTLLTEPPSIGLDYEIGALDAVMAATGVTSYQELEALVC